ncbi:MAG: sulfate adenylyltransferase subunit CysD [Pseudobdellovibrio sp.]
MTHLKQLEEKSIYLLRESFHHFKGQISMLWSVGKDSTVMLHLVKKAFLGRVPFPLMHIDTSFKIPEMIEFRDRVVKTQKLDMIVGRNSEALKKKLSFPSGSLTRLECCQILKTQSLIDTSEALVLRERFNHQSQKYEPDSKNEAFKALIMGIRADEEGSRSKERYFSIRSKDSSWKIEDMPAELWDEFNTDLPAEQSCRIHPLLDWSEKNIWEYIAQENIEVSDLYFDRGSGERYRSLGCAPCTNKIKSAARNAFDIIAELSHGELSKLSERSGRAQDKENGNSLEALRRKGYM